MIVLKLCQNLVFYESPVRIHVSISLDEFLAVDVNLVFCKLFQGNQKIKLIDVKTEYFLNFREHVFFQNILFDRVLLVCVNAFDYFFADLSSS